MMIYTNPRKSITIEDWPYGSKRTKCYFSVEQKGSKERAVRVTINPKTGAANKPKKLTYSLKVLFVDGSDGKTYIMQDVGWAINIAQSNMCLDQEYVNRDDTRYIGLYNNSIKSFCIRITKWEITINKSISLIFISIN